MKHYVCFNGRPCGTDLVWGGFRFAAASVRSRGGPGATGAAGKLQRQFNYFSIFRAIMVSAVGKGRSARSFPSVPEMEKDMKLLLVEDERRMAQALCEILCQERYDVDCCYDGLSGLDAAESNIYDLIILGCA